MLQLYVEGLIIFLLGRCTLRHMEKSTSLGKWGGGGGFVLGVMLCGTWDLSFPTKDPTCAPALKCDVLTTGPPGKSQGGVFRYWGERRKDDCTPGGFGHEYLDTSQGWTEEGK